MKKTLLPIVLASILGPSLAQAQANDYIVSTEAVFSSEYVFRGVKEAGPTVMPAVEIQSRGNPGGDMYLGAWAAMPARGDFENEVNAYAGFDAELQHNFFVDIGAAYYHFPMRGPANILDDTIEPYLGLRMEEIADSFFSGGGYVFYDIDKSFTVEGFVEYSQPFEGGIPATLDLGAFLGYTDEDRRFEEDHTYYGAYATIPYQLNEVATLTAGVHYMGRSGLDNTPIDSSRDFVYWTAGLNLQY